MPTYRVPATMTISLYVDVDAESVDDALKLAERAPLMSLCHQCARGEDGAWSTSGELDGEPEICDASEVINLDDDIEGG